MIRLLSLSRHAIFRLRKGGNRGFTLIELLVAMILAFLVIVPLMGFMLNMISTDRQEQVKTTSDQEIQVALEYITQDLEQAVYIYDAEGLNNNSISDSPGIKNQIPPIAQSLNCNDPTTCIPVLVFWKREFNQDAIPVNNSTINQKNDSFVYSLVAYYLKKDRNIKSNAAQIGRFQIKDGVRNPDNLDNYVDENAPDIGRSPGFKPFNLSLGGTLKQKMNRWTNDGQNYTARTDVLVNYIYQGDITANCPPNTQQVPSTLTGGFYACVDSSSTSAQINLQGNALARLQENAKYNPNQAAYFPTASVQVQGRGLLNE